MSWMEHRSEIDIEIANCYEQIQELKKRITILEAKKAEEERIDDLIKKINKEVIV